MSLHLDPPTCAYPPGGSARHPQRSLRPDAPRCSSLRSSAGGTTPSNSHSKDTGRRVGLEREPDYFERLDDLVAQGSDAFRRPDHCPAGRSHAPSTARPLATPLRRRRRLRGSGRHPARTRLGPSPPGRWPSPRSSRSRNGRSARRSRTCRRSDARAARPPARAGRPMPRPRTISAPAGGSGLPRLTFRGLSRSRRCGLGGSDRSRVVHGVRPRGQAEDRGRPRHAQPSRADERDGFRRDDPASRGTRGGERGQLGRASSSSPGPVTGSARVRTSRIPGIGAQHRRADQVVDRTALDGAAWTT